MPLFPNAFKALRISFFVFLISIFSLTSSFADQLFFDNFDGGNLSDHNWVSNDEYLDAEVVKWDILDDGSRAPQPWCAGQNSGGATAWQSYANNMITTLKKEVDLSDYKNCVLKFQYAIQVEDTGDYLEVRVNGNLLGTYQTDHEWGDLEGDWVDPESISLADYRGVENVTLEFRFISDGSGNTGYGAFVDDIELTCDIDDNLSPVLTNTATSYDFGSSNKEVIFSVHYSDESPPETITLFLNDVSTGYASTRPLVYAAKLGETTINGTYEVTVDLSELADNPNLTYQFYASDGFLDRITSAKSFVLDIYANRTAITFTPESAAPGEWIQVEGYFDSPDSSQTFYNVPFLVYFNQEWDFDWDINNHTVLRAIGSIEEVDSSYKFSFPIQVPESFEHGNEYFLVVRVDPDNQLEFFDSERNVQMEPLLVDISNRGLQKGANCTGPIAGDPVNTALGNFVYEHTDLQYPGIGLNFKFQRYYNSQGGLDSPIGSYWNHSYNIYLYKDVIPGESSGDDWVETGNITVVYGDGKQHKYIQNGDLFDTPHGVFRTLVENSDGTYTITRKNLEKFHFNATGQLTSMEDRYGNTMLFSYTGENLTTIADSQGRIIELKYTYEAGRDRISRILGPFLPNLGAEIRQEITYSYDNDGNLISVTDPELNTSSYSYSSSHDDKHMLTQVVDAKDNIVVINTYGDADGAESDHGYYVIRQDYADGGSTSFEYNLTSRTTAVTKTDGHTYYQAYDIYYRLLRETEPDGYAMHRSYDSQGNLYWVQDKKGYYTFFTYDEWGNLLTKYTPDGVVTKYEYTGLNDIQKKTDAYSLLNHETVYHWSSDELFLEQIEDPDGYFTTYDYNSSGQKTSEQLPENTDKTLFEYLDTWGNLTNITDTEGNETTMEYDARGLVIRKVDSLGFWAEYVYDLNGNLKQEISQLGTVYYEYDANNNRTAIVDLKNKRTEYEYDAKDRLTLVRDPLGREEETLYDTSDRKKQTIDYWDNTTVYAYNNVGLLETISLPDTTTATSYYDRNGNLVKTVDGGGKEWAKSYDNMNRVLSETDPLGNVVKISYDKLGRIETKTDANSNITQFSYNKRGFLETVTDPEGGQSVFSYDGNGNRRTEKDARENTVNYGYDQIGRVTSITDRNSKQTLFTYHGATSLPATKTNGDNEQAVYNLYTDRPKINSIDYPGTMGTVTFSHDVNGNLLSMVDSAGTTTWLYDDISRVTQVEDPFGRNVGYAYSTPPLHESVITYPDTNTVTYSFDEMNRLETVTDWTGFTTTYNYNTRGLLSTVVNDTGTQVAYGYDDAGRLISKNDTKSDDSLIASFDFSIDPAGNRLHADIDAPLAPVFQEYSVAGTYDQENQLETWDSATYTSDDSGRQSGFSDGNSSTSYSFRFDDRLTSLTNGNNTWNYTYNGMGNRLSSTSTSTETRYVLDLNGEMDRVLAETDNSGTLTASYVYGAGLLYRIDADGSRHHFHFDPLGSTIAMSDEVEAVTDSYAYDPYGKVVNNQGTDSNRYLYVGQHGVMQEDNGLQFMRARYYDPETNRFLSRDPVKGGDEDTLGMNPYFYTGGNPIVAIDPKGERTQAEMHVADASLREATRREMERLEKYDMYLVDGAVWSVGEIGGVIITQTTYTHLSTGIVTIETTYEPQLTKGIPVNYYKLKTHCVDSVEYHSDGYFFEPNIEMSVTGYESLYDGPYEYTLSAEVSGKIGGYREQVTILSGTTSASKYDLKKAENAGCFINE